MSLFSHGQYTIVGSAMSGGSSPPPPPAYTTGGVSVDNMTGISTATLVAPDNSPFGLFSLWLYPITDTDLAYYATTSSTYWTVRVTNGEINVDVWDADTNAKEFQFDVTQADLLTLNAWNNVLIAIDTNHGAGAKMGLVTVNGVSKTVTVQSDADAAFDIGWAVLDETLTITQVATPDVYWADHYAALGQFLDISTAPNIAKFISGGKPVDLGADGSTPTGTAPAIFLRAVPGSEALTFPLNLGTGGLFTVTGLLTAAPSSPSD